MTRENRIARRMELGPLGLAASALFVLFGVVACASHKVEAAPAPAAGGDGPAASSGSQCGKDSDCKGDRICTAGACVSPH